MAKRRDAREAVGSAARKAEPRAPSQRQLRVGELIRHALSEVLAREELRDPLLAETPVTVTEVRPSPDLRHAACFVMPLGGGRTAEVVDALNRSAPWLSGQIARRVKLRFSPRLAFRPDESFDYADRITTLLKSPEVAGDLGTDESGEDSDRE